MIILSTSFLFSFLPFFPFPSPIPVPFPPPSPFPPISTTLSLEVQEEEERIVPAARFFTTRRGDTFGARTAERVMRWCFILAMGAVAAVDGGGPVPSLDVFSSAMLSGVSTLEYLAVGVWGWVKWLLLADLDLVRVGILF